LRDSAGFAPAYLVSASGTIRAEHIPDDSSVTGRLCKDSELGCVAESIEEISATRNTLKCDFVKLITNDSPHTFV
jgi:hypothetical protein